MNSDPQSSPRWLSQEEQAFWRLLLATVRKASRCIEETLVTDHGLSTSEFAVLVSLSENPDRQMRLRDICLDLDWDRSRASHQITRMERRGLVHKTRCAGDARGVVVGITREGTERLIAAAPKHVESVQRLIFDGLDRADIPLLTRYLQMVLSVDNVPGAEGYDPERHAFPDNGVTPCNQ
ncbi:MULTISPECIES: MarR family winged helix-turn-helix transcriptional regulator [unclassified Corynebacterium]|uniref:MarR family winged helix-turn-helix transcriptional regulator n=1 Tax=unclassified Corynebacterium TaxID=2624378 RepID=UPI0035250A5D